MLVKKWVVEDGMLRALNPKEDKVLEEEFWIDLKGNDILYEWKRYL